MKEHIWVNKGRRGEAASIVLQRPCECGCDRRGGDYGVGYLLGTDGNGNGFTVWIEDEKVYKLMQNVLSRCL